MAGGVALNCVANGRILKETPFESVWVTLASNRFWWSAWVTLRLASAFRKR